ncbi:hypothetical protein [Hydrogenophaga sp. OTU3427]|uniref:hypothetical protein n=1 Tax=Hydrogenophaga sp. OTU3427 TaxID=3043856 RepID=UPI00313B38CB
MRSVVCRPACPRHVRWSALSVALLLGGCDLLGIETAPQIAAQKEAEGKAIGSACRHAERSIEECYQNNTKAGKAAVFTGWREMDEYMRENKVAGMPPKPKPAMIEETADGEPVGKAGTSHSASAPAKGGQAPGSAVRPTAAGAPPIPSIKPILPAANGGAPSTTTPPRPAGASGTGTGGTPQRPATNQRSG